MILTIKHTVERLDVSAREWQLYTSEPGAEHAAVAINARVLAAINSSSTADEAFTKAYEVLGDFTKYGATDTEPRGVLQEIIGKVFGRSRHFY